MSAPALIEGRAPARVAPAGWEAGLELRFERVASRTVLAARRHVGPLCVQKTLYPEGPAVCQAIVVHPPGGIVAGDSLRIEVDALPHAHAQLTTPGAAKWYRSAGPGARSDTVLRVATGALVEWLPQETMLFDGARAEIRFRVELAGDARFIGWDVTQLGRTASGERYATGRMHQAVELLRDDTMLWCERAVLEGGSRALQSGAILGGAPVYGTMMVGGVDVDGSVLAACRAAAPTSGAGAVTRLPQLLVARYRGDCAHAARTYFATLWRLLRPVLAGREAVPPRIWNT
jgi:urease accessory protein